MFLIPIIWLGYSYQWGIRIFYWFTFNNLMIHFAKTGIGWPRPSTDLAELGMFHPISNGFPSGGATMCLFLGALLIYYWKTRLAWALGLTYILLISFSRLYLGVHYPIDILGGWILASILLLLFFYLGPFIEKFLQKVGRRVSFLLSVAIPIAIMMIGRDAGTYFVMGSTLGVGLGVHASLAYKLYLPKPKNFNEGFTRSFIGIVALFMIVFLLPGKLSFAKSFGAGLFMSLLASPICKWFMSKKSD
jgi:hypothetical protein